MSNDKNVIKVYNDGFPILFLKTVKRNGDSCWAVGKFNRNYKVGERYTFDPEWPAHVFLPINNVTFDRNTVYINRRESNAGSRVLICYGVVKEKKTPCFSVYDNWYLSESKFSLETKLTCDDFVVIGEMTELGDLQRDSSEYSKNDIKVIEDQPVVTPIVLTTFPKIPKRDSKGRFVSKKK